MKRLMLTTLLLLIGFIAACQDPEIVSPVETEQLLNKGEDQITVMTRNVYVGTDVDQILQEQDPNQIPLRVAEAFQTLQNTNFPERAEAMAKEIYLTQPHLIGLQEISLVRMQSPGDAVVGGSVPAEEVVMDYLEIFMLTLNSLGLEYDVVAKIQNFDVEMPMIVNDDPLEFNDVRLTDYNVTLAKRGIKITDVEESNYRAKVVIPESGIELPCGYAAVTAEINNNKYRFVNTHLQDADLGGELLQVQLTQAAEMKLKLIKTRIPVILVGDFNTAAPNEETYVLLTQTNRFIDAWLYNSDKSNVEGYTYGHDSDLLNPSQKFWKRIDYVFFRKGFMGNKCLKLASVHAEVVGDEIADKTSTGLWPSDHGGLAAALSIESVSLSSNVNNN